MFAVARNVEVTDLSSGDSCTEYYFFRCEVTASLRLTWKVAGEEKRRFGPTSELNIPLSEDNFNFLLIKRTGDAPSQDFVSYMWLNHSLVHESLDVSCESHDDEMMTTLVPSETFGKSSLIIGTLVRVMQW